MDFVTLANSAHETSRSLLRMLTEEDDDFTHLENVDGTGTGSTAGESNGMGGEDMNRPLLSPTAEAALLELSTNFLLCELSLNNAHLISIQWIANQTCVDLIVYMHH